METVVNQILFGKQIRRQVPESIVDRQWPYISSRSRWTMKFNLVLWTELKGKVSD